MFVQQTWLHCYAALHPQIPSRYHVKKGWLEGAGVIRIYKLASKKGLHLPSLQYILTSRDNCDNDQLADLMHTGFPAKTHLLSPPVTFLCLQQSLALQDVLQTNV